MASTMLTCAPTAAAVSQPGFRSGPIRRGCLRSACRFPVRAQLHDNMESSQRDLIQGGSPAFVAGLATLAPLALTAVAHAEEATTDAAAAVASSGGGFGSGEAVLLITPVVIYALFNVYRDRLNPQAKFLDYVYIMATLAIFANLFSILVFKTRFF